MFSRPTTSSKGKCSIAHAPRDLRSTGAGRRVDHRRRGGAASASRRTDRRAGRDRGAPRNDHRQLHARRGRTDPPGPGLSARRRRGAVAAAAARSEIHELVVALGGTVPTEYGIGRHKRAALAAALSPELLALNRRIKHAVDPTGILNPKVWSPRSVRPAGVPAEPAAAPRSRRIGSLPSARRAPGRCAMRKSPGNPLVVQNNSGAVTDSVTAPEWDLPSDQALWPSRSATRFSAIVDDHVLLATDQLALAGLEQQGADVDAVASRRGLRVAQKLEYTPA